MAERESKTFPTKWNTEPSKRTRQTWPATTCIPASAVQDPTKPLTPEELALERECEIHSRATRFLERYGCGFEELID